MIYFLSQLGEVYAVTNFLHLKAVIDNSMNQQRLPNPSTLPRYPIAALPFLTIRMEELQDANQQAVKKSFLTTIVPPDANDVHRYPLPEPFWLEPLMKAPVRVLASNELRSLPLYLFLYWISFSPRGMPYPSFRISPTMQTTSYPRALNTVDTW